MRGPHDELTTVAIDLSDVQSTVRSLIWSQVGIGAAVLLVLGDRRLMRSCTAACGRWPRSSRQPRPSPPEQLDRRIPQRDPRTEVGRLSFALNGMLAQIQRAVASSESSAEQARSSEERMRRFITDASHELRTPLTTIRGFAELYRQGAARDVEMLMSRIESESRRMGLLVEDLLLLARLDAQRPLNSHRVDLLALASDAVHDAQSIAPKRTITMEVFDGPGTPEVLGDEARLRQVLGNLVANALQHTPETARITVRVGTDDDDAVLEVADEGPGMSQRTRTGCSSGSTAPTRRATADQRRHRAGAVDRRLAGLRARRNGSASPPRPGKGCRFRVEPAAHRGRPRRRRRRGAVGRAGRAERSGQFGQRRLDLGLRLVERLRRRIAVDVGEAEIGQVVGGEDVHVQVRHLQAGDDHAGALGAERLAHRLADALRDRHDPAEHGGVDVLPLIDLGTRHHQRVALRHRFDGQERHDSSSS